MRILGCELIHVLVILRKKNWTLLIDTYVFCHYKKLESGRSRALVFSFSVCITNYVVFTYNSFGSGRSKLVSFFGRSLLCDSSSTHLRLCRSKFEEISLKLFSLAVSLDVECFYMQISF